MASQHYQDSLAQGTKGSNCLSDGIYEEATEREHQHKKISPTQLQETFSSHHQTNRHYQHRCRSEPQKESFNVYVVIFL
jgi:sRNA-binding protein